MFDPSTKRVFALPPGCDFPAALVAGLQARLALQPADAIARVTLYVNTNRMKARIISLFAQSGASFLPKLRLITELGADPRLNLPKPASTLRRQLELTTLISALLKAEPNLAPRAATFDLAVSLTQLLDEMQGEGVSPHALAQLDVSQHAAHWERAQAFLQIIAPIYAQDNGPEARGRAAVAQLAALWQNTPPQDPIILAGSTGSRRATAELMQAITALPQGAVVLPGYDFDLPNHVWQQMDDALTSEDHPQYRFRKLMDRLNIAPDDITPWHSTAPSARAPLISLSLRPAPVTDQWLRDGPSLGDLHIAAQDMTLIEAPSMRSEALAIALVLRKAAQDGVKAALITPDRTLSRQVTAALDRFGIIPDDSAGRPLALSAAGRFLRHMAEIRCETLTVDRLITVLKHPLTGSGAARGAHLLLTRELELHLRRYGPAFPTHDDVLHWAKTQSLAQAAEWAQSLAPLFNAKTGTGPMALAEHIQTHRALAEAVAGQGSGALWQGEAGEKALQLMTTFATEASAMGESPLDVQDYRHMFDSLIHREDLREASIAHPDILIWGTIEARVQGCDLVILGGLNDAIWPKLPTPDPWLNRKMRKDAGLLLPDRQIGLSAHDYQQAICAPKVVLTRALRSSESETVPSRWLNRLINLMQGLPNQNGDLALQKMRARGQNWLSLAALIDQPLATHRQDENLKPSPRPAPQPPIAARPKELALTALEQLIINPYHIYARNILRLRPLPPLRAQADARDRGIVIHKILEKFIKSQPEKESRAAAKTRLLALANSVLQQEIPFPMTRALWLARITRTADAFLAKNSHFEGTSLAIETQGRLHIAELDFTVFGTPDRIDLLPDGTLHLIDYKTGAAPKDAEQKTHKKQLLFAALMAKEGGFGDIGSENVALISYVSLGSKIDVVQTRLSPDRLKQEWNDLTGLIAAYQQPQTGYTARRADFETRLQRDYDHLSRYGEWQTSDPAYAIWLGADEDKP